MNISIRVVFGLLISFIIAAPALSAPWEVLSDISYMRKGGVNAVRIDFALPVHFVSNFPAKHGKTLTINIRFDKQEVPDTSELPLLQTVNAPPSLLVPLKDVTYMTESGQPKLVINFKQDVNFNVSQVMGIRNLVVFLPEKRQADVVDPTIRPIEREITAVDESKNTDLDEKAKRILDEGRAALRNGDNKKAILIFTKLLSMPKHKYIQPSLELLGLARERNNQAAQAKAVYDDYLQRYPKGDGNIRVKQRLADLISSQMTPRERLKETKTTKLEKQHYTTQFYGNVGQYMDYSISRVKGDSTNTDAALLENQASMTYRIRSENVDIRNVFSANYNYDTVNRQSDKGIEVNYLYSRMKNRKWGLNGTIGRQRSSSIAGVFGRFDGASLGYALADKVELDLVGGYPVLISDKRNIQTDQPLVGVGLELNDFWKGLDLRPYLVKQKVYSMTDRESLGTDVRYLNDKFSLNGLLDYDIYFSDINFLNFSGQYNLTKKTNLTFSFNYQKTPFLESLNALLQLDPNITIEKLLQGYNVNLDYVPANGTTPAAASATPVSEFIQRTPDQIKALAEDRTGDSSSVSFGVSHSYTNDLSLTGTFYYTRSTTKSVVATVPSVSVAGLVTDYETLNTDASVTSEKQLYLNVQLIDSRMFNKRDTGIAYVALASGSTYHEVTGSMSYRYPFGKLRSNTQIQVRRRNSTNGEILTKFIPALKLEYRLRDAWQLYFDTSLEFWHYSGDTKNDDLTTANFFFGYNYNF